MKKISLYTFISGMALISCLASCLKDNTQPDFTQNKPVIELPIGSSAGNGGGNSIAASFTVGTTPSDYFVWVNYAAPNAPSQDVVVTLAVDTAAVTKFNQVNSTTYSQLPANGYTLTSNKITIPKGTNKVKFPIKINTINLDPTKTYALPISIVDGGGFTVSGNFGLLISIITLKNKWDGVYTVTGSMLDNTSTTLSGSYPRTLKFVTQGTNSVAVYDDNANGGSYGHTIASGTGTSYYGSFSPLFTIDPTTNIITSAVNYYGQPSANGRSARLDATGENKFTMSADGTTPVSLKVKYIMVQAGADRSFFDETWTYTGSR
ncbi:DUF1735 domain-containing protein [Pedobacter sp. L105]|uniref:DUF1735 domain-containing protein n=1 Tax=Pedobacter sp. L105 TaxID=1641871 RepID=UPI00131EB3B3|nr:DUF1735 domain-containing protein [Pedobacter sp. L105]